MISWNPLDFNRFARNMLPVPMRAHTKNSVRAHARKCAAERTRIESSRDWVIYLAIFQHPVSFRRMLVVERACPGSAAGHGHEPEDGVHGEKGDGGISQGISGISPRGGLVNCSVGMEEEARKGGGRRRGGRRGVWVYQLRGQKWVPAEEPRGNERVENESGDTNHGRVTDLRRLTGRPRPSTTADAFAEKCAERWQNEAKNGTRKSVPLTSLEFSTYTQYTDVIRYRTRRFLASHKF